MSKLTHGHGGRRAKALPIIVMLASLAAVAPAHAKAPAFRWEKIHLKNVRPSQLFTSLGLDHTVRYGHTRGNGKQGTDPNFPAGMTDIVPLDADKTLIIRGTPEGCAHFRQVVRSADVPPPRWQIQAELLRVQNGREESVARQSLDSVTPDTLQKLTFTVDGQDRAYQIRLRPEANGAIGVSYQYSMQLPPAPIAQESAEGRTPAPEVFAPAQIWSPAARIVTTLGAVQQIDDLAAQRQAPAPTVDGQPANMLQVLGEDYRLRLTIVLASEAPAQNVAVPIPTPER
ncbi:MAG: hypothetical protein JWQ02_1220 [Capsulimonas sp.]|nr:hypothetical protein [Capsulimonas sp.]